MDRNDSSTATQHFIHSSSMFLNLFQSLSVSERTCHIFVSFILCFSKSHSKFSLLLLISKTTAFPFTSDAALETFFFPVGRTGCKQYNKHLATSCDWVISTTEPQTTYTDSICRKHFLPCYFGLFPCLPHLHLCLTLQDSESGLIYK